MDINSLLRVEVRIKNELQYVPYFHLSIYILLTSTYLQFIFLEESLSSGKLIFA